MYSYVSVDMLADDFANCRTMTVVTGNVRETCQSHPGDILPASPAEGVQEDSVTAPPPPLVPRRPARRHATVGPMPRRRIPAIPPPVDPATELDPAEQNRINEAVWVRRVDTDDDDEEERPPLPARTRRCVADNADRIKSAPVTRLTPSFCCLHHHHLLEVVPSPPVDNVVSDTHVMIGLQTAVETTSSVFPQHGNSNVQPASAASGRPQQQHGAASSIVALPRWPVSTSPERNLARTALGVAGRRARTDNEYVPSPSRGSQIDAHVRPLDCNENNTASESLRQLQRSHCPTDVSEKKRTTSSDEDNRTGDCVSSGPMVCPRCGGCRCKSCSDADRRVRSAVELCSCVGPVRYLCRSGADPSGAECFDDRGTVRGRRGGRRCRHVALGALVAALCLPCLCCYWPMRAGHEVVSACKRKFSGQLGVCRCKNADTGGPI
jgi:hypothetical protein